MIQKQPYNERGRERNKAGEREEKNDRATNKIEKRQKCFVFK